MQISVRPNSIKNLLTIWSWYRTNKFCLIL